MPRVEVKGGAVGYVPCIWLMSAGLRGEARVRRVSRVECGGEMEWVCRLADQKVSIDALRQSIGERIAYERTSLGEPCWE